MQVLARTSLEQPTPCRRTASSYSFWTSFLLPKAAKNLLRTLSQIYVLIHLAQSLILNTAHRKMQGFCCPRRPPKASQNPPKTAPNQKFELASISFYRYMVPKALPSCPQPASKASLRRFLDHFGSILGSFLEAISSQLVTSNLLPLAFSS